MITLRFTRPRVYDPGTIGHTDPGSRQGYYVRGESLADIVDRLCGFDIKGPFEADMRAGIWDVPPGPLKVHPGRGQVVLSSYQGVVASVHFDGIVEEFFVADTEETWFTDLVYELARRRVNNPS